MLRGPYLHPTAATQFFQAEGYAPAGKYGTDWIRKPEGLKSQFTRDNWETTLRLLQKRHEEKRVNEFTEGDLVAFINEGKDPRTGRLWSPNTRLTRRTGLMAFFDWAAYNGLVAVDPAARLKRLVRVRAQGVRSHIWLTGPEVSLLLSKAVDGTARGLRDLAVLSLLVNTGLRCTEAQQLRWRQVNLFAPSISLIGKGGKPATIPIMVTDLVEFLRDWRARAERTMGGDVSLLPVLPRLNGEGPIGQPQEWALRWDSALSSITILKAVRARGVMSGHPTLAPHDLRRTFAGLLENNGTSLQQISHLLRHSSVATTEKYLEGNPGRFDSQRLQSLY
jgi:integrase